MKSLGRLARHDALHAIGATIVNTATNETFYEPDDLDVSGLSGKEAELVLAAEATEYQRLRKAEYDKLCQYELIFEDRRDGTNKWTDAIMDIKAKFPKPNQSK